MKHLRIATLLAALAVPLAGLAQAQAPLSAPAAPQGPTARVTELGDRFVVDASGAKLVDIYDVVIDTEEARAAYLVVSVGMRVVPIALPSPEVAAAGDKVVLRMSRSRLESLPSLDMSALGPRYKRGRDMAGGVLFDQAGAKIAEVKDLVVGLADGTLASVVVAFDPKAWDQPGWVALPRTSVRPQGRDFIATFSLDDMRPASQAAAEQRARDAARAKAVSVDRDERMSSLVGRKIVDAQGKPVGELSDLAIDPATGRILHALVNAGGSPLALALPSPQLKRAGDEIVLAGGLGALAPPSTTQAARRATELMKKTLVDARGKDVGRVRDLVVNLGSAKVHYAVAEFDGAWVSPGHLVTVRLPKDDGKVELNQLMGAMIFEPKSWPAADLNNEQYLGNIDKYLAR
jgi:sporulation protein YlmC with PRC-barrel domain